MKNHLTLSLLSLLMMGQATVVAAGKADRKEAEPAASESRLFLYSPGEKHGFHAAYAVNDSTFRHIGQLFSSDYSRWGAEKRMYSPFITRLESGGYAVVFSGERLFTVLCRGLVGRPCHMAPAGLSANVCQGVSRSGDTS